MSRGPPITLGEYSLQLLLQSPYCRGKELAVNFIERGADVNAAIAAGLLQVALEMYHIDVAETLIQNGCDVNKLHQGRTALMNAAKTSSNEVWLILQGH